MPRPWYSRQPPLPPPFPIDTIRRPWIIDKLANGMGCPDLARCGTGRRDGDGCRYTLDDPNAPRLRCDGCQEGTGAVGLFLWTRENVQLFTPQSLRKYALAWRRQWGKTFSCRGYEGIGYDMGCQGAGPLEGYARSWRKLWGSGDHTDADMPGGLLGKPKAAFSGFLTAIDTCLQAGNEWKECARLGDIAGLRSAAIKEGVPASVIDQVGQRLGTARAEEQTLRIGIKASCELHTNSGSSVCGSIADAVTDAAVNVADYLLSKSGQKLQDHVKASYDSMSRRIIAMNKSDPQNISALATYSMQQAWDDTLSALVAAWVAARNQAGLPMVHVDFETPLKQYLLSNGWNSANSHPWEHGASRVWLLGTKEDPSTINPGTADHTSWPWAAAFQRWDQSSCSSGCRVQPKDGLFCLYGVLRLDPLQQALRQGLRDIAVMVATEALPYSSSR